LFKWQYKIDIKKK